jgi:hypothetical protein
MCRKLFVILQWCVLIPFVFLLGCASSSLLPSSKEVVSFPWNSFDEVKDSFDQIIAYQTSITDLKRLGFSPALTPNIQMLNYLDIMQRFLPNQSITVADLPPGLQECLADQEHCHAYEIVLRKIETERYGNVLLDIFNFRRKTAVSGWEFKAIIVMKDELVVYKLRSGKPKVEEYRDRKNPLGPLQGYDKILWDVVE